MFFQTIDIHGQRSRRRLRLSIYEQPNQENAQAYPVSQIYEDVTAQSEALRSKNDVVDRSNIATISTISQETDTGINLQARCVFAVSRADPTAAQLRRARSTQFR